MIAFLIGAVVYLLAVAGALLLCKGITLADRIEQPDLDDHFDGIPVDCLSPAEIDRRIERLEAWL